MCDLVAAGAAAPALVACVAREVLAAGFFGSLGPGVACQPFVLGIPVGLWPLRLKRLFLPLACAFAPQGFVFVGLLPELFPPRPLAVLRGCSRDFPNLVLFSEEEHLVPQGDKGALRGIQDPL